MNLSQNVHETVIARAARDPAFAMALREEAALLLSDGEFDVAGNILRDLEQANACLQPVAAQEQKHAQS